MSMTDPVVTVLMPVYNGEKYLREAIESILNQTFTDFEFLIINDGSTDKSKEIILSYNDPRIRFVENENNIMLIESLNIGIQLAKGKYVARMDCDDISLPERLEKQVEFMEINQGIVACGTNLKTISYQDSQLWQNPINHNEMLCQMLFSTAIFHPTAIFRKQILINNKIFYSKEYPHAEDYELWYRLSQNYKLANLNLVLYLYRIHEDQVTKKFDKVKNESANNVRKSMLLKIMPDANEEEINFHLNVVANINLKSKLDLNKVLDWFEKLVQSNKKSNYMDDTALRQVLSEKWALICITNRNIFIWFKSLFGSFAGKNSLTSFILLKIPIKIIYNYLIRLLK
jgi:glycosyltransferase involved in cell wall biosynthesis